MLNGDEVLQALSQMDIPEARTEEEAQVVSAQKWAFAELYNILSDNPFDDPEDLIFLFREKMWVYSGMPTEIEKEINPFLVAKSFAEDLLLMFECPVEE